MDVGSRASHGLKRRYATTASFLLAAIPALKRRAKFNRRYAPHDRTKPRGEEASDSGIAHEENR
jgi:hypothetical protein